MMLIRQKGFTIIELLIVAAIIALLAGGLALNLRKTESNLDLERVANRVINDLRDMQSRALAGEQCPSNPATLACPTDAQSTKKLVPEGGYGIRLSEFSSEKARYSTFADYRNDGCTPAVWQTLGGPLITNNDEIIKTSEYNEGSTGGDMSVDDLFLQQGDGTVSNPNVVHIVFQPGSNGIAVNGRDAWLYNCALPHYPAQSAGIQLKKGSASCSAANCVCIYIRSNGEMKIEKSTCAL